MCPQGHRETPRWLRLLKKKKKKAQAGVKHLEPEGHLCGQGLAGGEGKELRSQTLEIESNSVGSRSQ